MNNQLKGTIVSYLNNKYGFITGEDGYSYFFHSTSLLNNTPNIIGKNVIFNPKPTEKGLSAYNIRLAKAYSYQALSDFQFLLYGAKPKGDIKWKYEICTNKFHTIEEARANLIEIAKTTGCNTILDARLETRQNRNFSNNYISKMYSYSANLSIISEEQFCTEKEKAEQLNQEFDQTLSATKDLAIVVLESIIQYKKESKFKRILTVLGFIMCLPSLLMMFTIGQSGVSGLLFSIVIISFTAIPFLPGLIALKKHAEHISLVFSVSFGLPFLSAFILSNIGVPNWINIIIPLIFWTCGLYLSLIETNKVVSILANLGLLRFIENTGIQITKQKIQ